MARTKQSVSLKAKTAKKAAPEAENMGQPVLVPDNFQEYVVERILAKRVQNNRIEYLLLWKGFNRGQSTWEPVHHINAHKLIIEFEKRHALAANRAQRKADALKPGYKPPKKRLKLYIVERILNKRIYNNRIEYLLKWKNYARKESTWEPIHHINAHSLISTFERKYGNKINFNVP